jgi:hypothetical protein
MQEDLNESSPYDRRTPIERGMLDEMLLFVRTMADPHRNQLDLLRQRYDPALHDEQITRTEESTSVVCAGNLRNFIFAGSQCVELGVSKLMMIDGGISVLWIQCPSRKPSVWL